MLVIVKSAPDTVDGSRAVKTARDMAADIALLQNGVYFAQKERLEGFCGMVYMLEEDAKIRGLKEAELEKDIRKLDYNSLVDLMVEEDKVTGMF